VSRFRLLALQPSQRMNFGAAHWMHARRPILETAHMQEPAIKINLIPTKRAQLSRSQPVSIRNQDHGRVALPVSSPLARRAR
jgi:hypothetical protein